MLAVRDHVVVLWADGDPRWCALEDDDVFCLLRDFGDGLKCAGPRSDDTYTLPVQVVLVFPLCGVERWTFEPTAALYIR